MIDERVFVALVVLALVTSMLAGPMMSHLLRNREPAIEGDPSQPASEAQTI